MNNASVRLLAGIVGLWAFNVAGAADIYPTKPVRMVIAFVPGGSTDIVGRMLGVQLQERLGQSVVIDNRGGAGGVIGTELVARSAPDGYTLLIANGSHTFNPSLYKLQYDPIKSFTPVAMIGSGPLVLAAHPSLSANSVKELIAYAKANPGALNYNSGGVGAFGHLAGAMFTTLAGINVVHVPFRGGGAAILSLLTGTTQWGFGALNQYLPQILARRLRALGVSSLKRNSTLPDVPTIAEAGVPGFEAVQWWGIIAPKGTPAAIVNRLHKEIAAIQASAATVKRLESEGSVAITMSSAEFGKFIEVETARWAKVVKEAGITAE